MTVRTGVCLWLTGRSGAGKSTVTRALLPLLYQQGRTVTVLDVVPYLAKRWFERSSEGKLLRKAFVAAEIVRHGGIAICVTVSARRETRESIRNIVGEDHFVEVYVDSPAEVCLERKKSRNRRPSVAKRVTALRRRLMSRLSVRRAESYQPPASPEVIIDSHKQSPEVGATTILRYLSTRGFLDANEMSNSLTMSTAGVSGKPRSDLASERVLSVK